MLLGRNSVTKSLTVQCWSVLRIDLLRKNSTSHLKCQFATIHNTTLKMKFLKNFTSVLTFKFIKDKCVIVNCSSEYLVVYSYFPACHIRE